MGGNEEEDLPIGVILAGGAGRRMGGTDKAQLLWRDRPMIHHVIDRLAPQVSQLWLARKPGMARLSEHRVVPDSTALDGPLAGILAGLMTLAEEQQDRAGEWLVTAPVDGPLLPRGLVDALRAGAGDAPLVIAAGQQGPQPVIGLWHVSLAAPLTAAAKHDFSVRKAVATLPHRVIQIPEDPDNRFLNVNEPADLADP